MLIGDLTERSNFTEQINLIFAIPFRTMLEKFLFCTAPVVILYTSILTKSGV